MEENSKSEQTSYEIMVMLLPDLGEKQTESALDEVRELITSNGGKITHEDIWGVRDLAFKIRKQDQGFYAVFNFTMDAGNVREISAPLNINQEVMRYLITKTPAHYEFKTLEDYTKEAEEAKKAAEAAKKEEEEKKAKPVKKVSKPKEEEKVEKKVEEKVEKKAEEKEEVKESKPTKKSEDNKSKLDEVDEKLKSIIDDPDITL